MPRIIHWNFLWCAASTFSTEQQIMATIPYKIPKQLSKQWTGNKWLKQDNCHGLPVRCCQSTALQTQFFLRLLHCSLKHTNTKCINLTCAMYMLSPPICAQRRCPIRRWSSALRPHHWDARQPSLAVRVWAHTIQAVSVDLQIVAWIGSAVSSRRPYPCSWHA